MLDLWQKDLSRIGADLLPVLANNVTEGLDDEAPIRGLQYVNLRDLCVCWGWVEPGCVQLEGRSGLAAHVCHPSLEPGGSPRLFSGKGIDSRQPPKPCQGFWSASSISFTRIPVVKTHLTAEPTVKGKKENEYFQQ